VDCINTGICWIPCSGRACRRKSKLKVRAGPRSGGSHDKARHCWCDDDPPQPLARRAGGRCVGPPTSSPSKLCQRAQLQTPRCALGFGILLPQNCELSWQQGSPSMARLTGAAGGRATAPRWISRSAPGASYLIEKIKQVVAVEPCAQRVEHFKQLESKGTEPVGGTFSAVFCRGRWLRPVFPAALQWTGIPLLRMPGVPLNQQTAR